MAGHQPPSEETGCQLICLVFFFFFFVRKKTPTFGQLILLDRDPTAGLVAPLLGKRGILGEQQYHLSGQPQSPQLSPVGLRM